MYVCESSFRVYVCPSLPSFVDVCVDVFGGGDKFSVPLGMDELIRGVCLKSLLGHGLLIGIWMDVSDIR